MPNWLLVGALLLSVLLSGCANLSREATTRDQSASEIYVNLGQAYLQRDNLREAKSSLERSIELNPRNARAHITYAILQERLGQVRLADESYRTALQLAPDEGEMSNAYGVFLCRNQRFGDADRAFEQAYRNPLYESPERALTNAGLCALEADEHERAENLFRRALERNPRYIPALYEMAEYALEHGDYMTARAYWQRLTELTAHTAETLWLCYQIEQAIGNDTAATHCAMRLKNNFPTAPQTLRLQEIERVK